MEGVGYIDASGKRGQQVASRTVLKDSTIDALIILGDSIYSKRKRQESLLKLSHDAAEKMKISLVHILYPFFSGKPYNYHEIPPVPIKHAFLIEPPFS